MKQQAALREKNETKRDLNMPQLTWRVRRKFSSCNTKRGNPIEPGGFLELRRQSSEFRKTKVARIVKAEN